MGIVAMTFLIVVLPYPSSRISGYVASGVAATSPASTGRVAPETQRASSEVRSKAAYTTPEGSPICPANRYWALRDHPGSRWTGFAWRRSGLCCFRLTRNQVR